MTVLGSAFLLALPLAAAPLVLHLVDRRRTVPIGWGAMPFLRDAVANQSRSSRRLRQWLLLLLRTLAVVALVLALARPLLPTGLIGADGPEQTWVVVDNSLSMQRQVEGKTLHQLAASQLADLSPDRVLGTAPDPIDLTGPASPTTASPTTASTTTASTTTASTTSSLNTTVPMTTARGDLLAAVQAAIAAETPPESQRTRRRIVVLTDGQAGDWRLEDRVAWAAVSNQLATAPVPTTVDVRWLDESADPPANRSVDAVDVSQRVVGPGQTVQVMATLRAGQTIVPPSQLVWTVDGREFARTEVDAIDRAQSREVSEDFIAETPGAVRIAADWQLPAERETASVDAIAADNSAAVVVDVVREIPVVIVEGSPDLAELQQDGYLVRAALGAVDPLPDPAESGLQPDDGRSVYRPTLIEPTELESIDLSGQRVVIVPNLTTLSKAAVRRLREFVEAGGGLWIAAGPRTDADAFNHQLFAGGSGLSPTRLGPLVDATLRTWIDPFRSQHPATRAAADDNRLDLGEAGVRRWWRLQSPSSASADLLRTSSDEPLAVEQFLGRGRVIVQAAPLRIGWTDLPRTQAFVVLVRNWVKYLAEPRSPQFNLRPGQTLRYRLPVGNESGRIDGNSALLTPPHGPAIELTPLQRVDGTEVSTSRTRHPGRYTLEIGLAEQAIPFEVARDPRESDLTPLTAAARQQIEAGLSVSPDTVSAEATAAPAASDPAWPWLLLGLIGLVLADLVLSGSLSTDRMGGPTIAADGPPGIAPSSFASPSFNRESFDRGSFDSVAAPAPPVEGVAR